MSLYVSNAYVCLDCDALGDSSQSCARCGGGQVWPLAMFLNRSSSGTLGDFNLSTTMTGGKLPEEMHSC